MTRVIFAGGGTGGHLYPGLAIARALVRERPSLEPFFIGARRGIERDVLPSSGFPFALLDLHPLYRPAVWNNWRTLRGAFSAWREIGRIVRADPPALVVGTGGYAAGMMLGYAVLHHLPMVQQAGDSVPGLTARYFSRWSREIYLNFPEAARALAAHHPGSLVDTGAPIEPPPVPRPDKRAARERWGFPAEGGPVLLIYGGSQGSLAINRIVAEWIEHGIPERLNIIWATGRATYDQFKHCEGPRVRVREYLAPIAEAYAATDLAVARAGAMTTAELFAWGIPAILVPLPTAAADHQTTNAVTLEQAGAAVHVPQSALTVERLDGTVRRLLESPAALARLGAGAAARARPNAAVEIARRMLALIDQR
ncbi:MAG TPA: UDP-N-acetylglucosamine--N-acetylmuramyl-(pentapeptide) pyrophosphoryl-undecaprenol N-acetylglucosamine transferase [Gemmatimonadaceae bacterium]|nr:UDP-N-acetylglucosamine--N-acetylmuramyl-(pentapeptide) pyrophosphoryl-undecaprenol N-acetylglucosamine transferase [Gemmatimonadaceae bacterium]